MTDIQQANRAKPRNAGAQVDDGVDDELVKRAKFALERVDRHLASIDYAGPDPYDGLATSWSSRIPRGRAKQAVVQTVKRSPVDLRRQLGIGPMRMTKTLALAVLALTAAPSLPSAKSRAVYLAQQIDERRNPDGGWGYEFDVQTRWGFYPAGSSNAIVTAFAIEALMAVGADVPVSARAWIERDLVHPEGFLRYTANSGAQVHNANVLAARALWRVGGRPEQIQRALRHTVSGQLENGMWEYGVGRGLGWIDSFHTVYTLWGLTDLSAFDSALASTVEAGGRAWRTHFFSESGQPWPYADRPGRADVHTAAWAVLGSVGYAGPVTCEDRLRAQVAISDLLELQRSHGGFGSHGELSYPRWSSAHAFLAVAQWLAWRQRVDSPAGDKEGGC